MNFPHSNTLLALTANLCLWFAVATKATAAVSFDDQDLQDSTCCLEDRKTITFILGEDEPDSKNKYYSGALDYYRFNEEAKTDFLVPSCRSLLDVRNFLARGSGNGLPWGEINLVVHSNEWSDMGACVIPEGPRVSETTIQAAISSGVFTALPDSLLDGCSELIIQGCALGRNEAVLMALSQAFGGAGALPVVRSSRYFILYQPGVVSPDKYLADFWYTHYPTGYHPGNYMLEANLREFYPEAKIDWKTALANHESTAAGAAYTYSFRIPVVWYTAYDRKEDRPDVSTADGKMAWVTTQPELMKTVLEYGFSEEDFTWTVYPTHRQFSNGKRKPAIKGIGLLNIVCVLKPLIDEESKEPLTPALTDERFYASILPQ